MTALVQRHVLSGPIGRVVRGMTVVGGHRMPEGTKCFSYPVRTDVSEMMASDNCTQRRLFHETYEAAMARVKCSYC